MLESLDLKRYLEESKIIMVKVLPSQRAAIGYRIVADLLKMGDVEGIYVALNVPYNIAKKNIEKLGGDANRLFFIDCITASIGTIEEQPNVVFLDSPSFILLENALKHGLKVVRGRMNFVYMESLSTLLGYNSFTSFLRFLRKVTNEIRLYGLVGIIFMMEKELDEVSFSQVSAFVDEIVDLTAIRVSEDVLPF
jgi:hypothetical protein